MRRYASSKIRLVILMAVLVAAGFLVQQGMAQTTAPASSAPKGATLFQMVLDNLDPIFFTIFGLSILGLTLIIQGFMKNRASVLMPENTTQLIREMIAQH